MPSKGVLQSQDSDLHKKMRELLYQCALKIAAGGPKDLWDNAELLRLHPDLQSFAQKIAV